VIGSVSGAPVWRRDTRGADLTLLPRTECCVAQREIPVRRRDRARDIEAANALDR
jgi:hypothetical protein